MEKHAYTIMYMYMYIYACFLVTNSPGNKEDETPVLGIKGDLTARVRYRYSRESENILMQLDKTERHVMNLQLEYIVTGTLKSREMVSSQRRGT